MANRSLLISPQPQQQQQSAGGSPAFLVFLRPLLLLGSIVARYDKIHMFDAPSLSSSASESATSSRRACGLAAPLPWCRRRFCRIGLTVCYDLRFPSLYTRLALHNAQLITVPSAFTVGHRRRSLPAAAARSRHRERSLHRGCGAGGRAHGRQADVRPQRLRRTLGRGARPAGGRAAQACSCWTSTRARWRRRGGGYPASEASENSQWWMWTAMAASRGEDARYAQGQQRRRAKSAAAQRHR